jgi:polar amino acid transport system ATP-binding protein
VAAANDNVKIHISHLKKCFGKLEVINDISTDVYEGEVVVIIGPSGSGKSTLLRCINKLEEITDGQIIVDGKDITDKKVNINKVRENIGMVFQHFNLFNNLNVLRNLMLAPTDLKKASKAEIKEQALLMLQKVGLSDKAEAYPAQLSGGQKQRVAIARPCV